MLLVYTQRITNRVQYTFNTLLGSILGVQYELTQEAEHFSKQSGPKFSYSENQLGDELHYKSGRLLFETGIHPAEPDAADPIALSFYLLSRYEEYLPFTADAHSRFSAKYSYSHRKNFLHKPFVNILAGMIRKNISGNHPTFVFPEKKYRFTPTIDIDNAYAYRGKNAVRTIGGYVKAILKGNGDDFQKRKNVLDGKEKDPFDTYDLQFELHKEFDLDPVYFFLLADWAPNDKNLPHDSPLMQSLIREIAERAETGIHPSFASNSQPIKLSTEKERLEKTIRKKVTKSRQHFLKLRFPDTYQNLIAAGITDDYTMGYADEVGFRAGICTPFKWYDLQKEEETNLTIHPFSVMDGTLNSYLKLSPEQALEKVKGIVQEIKEVNGELITIWHNETLSDWREWKGWKEFYRKVLQTAS